MWKKLADKLEFEKINIEYLCAVIFLGSSLVLGTYKEIETLAGNIAAGMVGYIGGRGVGYIKGKSEAEKSNKKGAINNG